MLFFSSPIWKKQLTLVKVWKSVDQLLLRGQICYVITNQTYQAYFKNYTSQTSRREGWYYITTERALTGLYVAQG